MTQKMGRRPTVSESGDTRAADAARAARRCKLCGGPAHYLFDTVNYQSPTRVLHQYRCGACGCVFIGNTVTADELAVAYTSYNMADYYRQIQQENARKFASAVDDLREMLPRGAAILDIGCGDGSFLDMLLDEGYQPHGHEIPGTDLQRVEQKGCHIYYDTDYSSIPAERYDAVVLMDVAEHVIDPHALFRACARILRPGGMLYFHTPVVTRTDRLMQSLRHLPGLRRAGQAWQQGRTSIFHLQNYTPKAIRHVLGTCGFAQVSVQVRNELSWPVSGYVKVFLCQRFGLPEWLAPVLAPLFHPLLASNLLNPNKAIVSARRG